MTHEPTEMELNVAEALWRKWLTTVRDQTGVHATFASALAAWPGKCQRFLDEARTAIRAMREPTEEMLDAAQNDEGYYNDDARTHFEKMIDAASPEDS